MINSDARGPRRRNGRLAACTNCHARKVACDHGRPACAHCRRRGQAATCVYIDAAPVRPAETLSPPLVDTQRSIRGDSDSQPGSLRSPHARDEMIVRPAPGTGYLGFASYKAMFEESGDSSGPGLPVLGSGRRPDAQGLRQGFSLAELPSPLRETCLYVLRCLPGQCNEQFVFRTNEPTPAGWSYVAVDSIGRSLQETFGSILRQGESGLEAMAEILNRNSAQPMRDEDGLDAHQWIAQFSGENLRWESLGLLWGHLARISDMLDSLHGKQLDWINGKPSYEMALSCLGYCIEISRHFSEGSVLLLDISKRKATLDSIIDGDAAFASYGGHGVNVTMLTYLGLHAIENHASYKPSFLSEHKRRLFLQIFTIDKLNTAFTGRPFFLSRRFCSTPMPLDIRDEDLVADEAYLGRTAQALDQRGWNTEGGLYSVTVIRARYQIARIRDELMEMGLTKTTRASPESIASLLILKDRQNSLYLEFPESLIFQPHQLDSDTVDPKHLWTRILVRLEHFGNLFFAERLLLRHGNADSGNLLAVSSDMVSLTLKFWTHKDRFADIYMRRHFSWLSMAFAAPGAGILCQALRQPTFTSGSENPQLTRSGIVQQLSLLIGFFNWVPASGPNWDLCMNCKAIIERVLDHQLNAAPQDTNAWNNMDWGVLNQPDFNFDLLDTFDWVRTDVP